MDNWSVQVKGCGGDGGRSMLLCGKGYRQHPQRGEQMVQTAAMRCRIVVECGQTDAAAVDAVRVRISTK